MKNSVFMSAVLVLLASAVYFNVSAQSTSGPKAVAMTGDKDATWILTDDNELIYCWWPQSPDRRTEAASCRVLNKYRVNRIE